jgi:peptide-methionine (S)-S-oxide reductase
MEKALVAAGCFWGVQAYFDQEPGVVKSTVGYTGGHVENPTYEAVCRHDTGHAEATLLEFDPKIISYENILRHFFRLHDPTQLNRQGPDIGDQYRSAIFYFDENQLEVAKRIRDEVQADYDKPVVTEITQASTFYPAEEYHQKYTEKTGFGGCHIAYQPMPN